MRIALLFVALTIAATPVLAQTLSVDSDTTLLLHFDGNMNGAQGQTPQTESGVQFVPGVVGQGVNLTAGNQIFYAAANNINATQGTLEFWIKPNWNGNTQQNNYILSWGAAGGLLFGKDAASNWRMIASRFTQEQGVGLSASSWQAGQWKHAAFTWSATALCLYVNGSLVAQQAVVGTLPPISASTFQLGGDGTNVIDAVIDELRISKRARTADEINSDFATASAALGQFGIFTFADAAAGSTASGAVSYNRNGTTQTITQGQGGTVTYSNAPNTPNLTQATSQITASYNLNVCPSPTSCISGTQIATSLATVNLASGTMGVQASGNALASNCSVCYFGSGANATGEMFDILTFQVPGATSSTVTQIGVSYQVDGTYQPTIFNPSDDLTVQLQIGSGSLQWHLLTTNNPPNQVVANSGWVSSQITGESISGLTFNAVFAVTGANPAASFFAKLALNCKDADCDYGHTGTITLTLPPGVTFKSATSVFLTNTFPNCNDTLDSGGQAFAASGGNGVINVTAPVGCDWSVSGVPNWVVITGAANGTGSGTVNYQVQPNAGAGQTATFTIAGQSFIVDQQAASLSGLNFIGSLAHLAAQENWTTEFTLINKSAAAATARLSFSGDAIDPAGNGPLTLPLAFPQQASSAGPELAASFDRTLASNASLILNSAAAPTQPLLVGSAQLAATGAVDGFAIFHQIATTQEAVVPMETRNASSYLLAFDNTNGLVLGVALENVSPQNAVIPVIIRNEAGVVISIPGTTIPLGGNGHTSFVLSDPASGFPVTANIRGTIEFDTPPGGQISVLGIRFTPPNNALTTIPALANVGTGGGSIAHLASGGDGWQTTFVLVNTGTSSTQAILSFFNDQTGAPMSLPLAFPQTGGGTTMTVPAYTTQLAAGATLVIVSSGAPQLFTGSAQLTTAGKVSGFVIFRHNGQEAVVPLETRNANAYIIAFDNSNGTFTGVALNAVSAQQVNVPVVVRDDTGAQIATDTITLAPNGHYAFTLVSDKYPATANIRGTIEFDKPANAQIGALGIRIPAGAAHTYTTLPALAK